MRSVIFTSLIIFLAALAGGYCILWYSQANNLRSMLEQGIDQINLKQQVITYETITLSGFPWRLEAAIVKPHFKGRVNSLVKPLGEAAEETLGKPLPKLHGGWDEDFGSDGKIIFSVNTMANFYTLTFTGNWQHDSTVLGAPQATYVRQEGDTGCTMQLESGAGMFGMLWNFQSVTSDMQTFFSHFRILNCRTGGIFVTDSQTREELASIGQLSSSITHDTGRNGDDVHFYSKITDLKTTALGDNFVARYIHELLPYDFSPTNFSINGKQNSEIDISYNGPVTLQSILANPTFHLSINNYDISDSLRTLHVKGNVEGDSRLLNVSLNSELQYSELYDKQFPSVALGVIESFFNDNDPKFDPLRKAFKPYTIDQVYSIIYPTMFKPSAFGPISSTLNASYRGTPFFAHGVLTVSGARIASKAYGMALEGTSDIRSKEMLNTNFALNCSSCMRMADDLLAYLKRLQPTLQYFAPETAHSVEVLTADPANVKKVLSSVSTPSSNPNDPYTLRFVISSSPAKGITIGQKTIAELMLLLIPVDATTPTLKSTDKAAATPTKH